MKAYFIRRFLMIIPTFVGITLLSFVIMQFVPGGPVEKMIMEFKMGAAMRGEGGASGGGSQSFGGDLPEEAMKEIQKFYGFDKPVHVRYFKWLKNCFMLDLGTSYRAQEPVWDLIKKKFPISIRFGLIGFLLSYLVCVPLGVFKAIKHGSKFDAVSSLIVFTGYSVPGWAAGVILLMLFGGGSFWDVFPLGGIQASNHDSLPMMEQIWDSVYHMILPIFCYMIGSFATLTVLMKNSLMENLGQDYVRTAFAKGLSEKAVIFKHALRNSLIPIATGLGHLLSLVIAGSYLIEKVFNIQGIGYLGFTSIVQRDYPVAMGLIVVGSLLKLFGNIMSDVLYCLIDPRIRFN